MYRWITEHKRKIFFTLLGGIILSFCYIAGYQLDNYYTLDLMEKTLYLQLLLGTVGFSVVLYGLWTLVGRYGERLCAQPQIQFKLPYGVCVLFFFLCSLPAWLSLFPGGFAYDALGEWEQFKNQMITSHHPVIHVCVVGGLLEFFHDLTGSYNVGIAVYTFCQMVIMANIFAIALRIMKKLHFPGIFQWIAFLFWGFSPVIQLFSISVTKDVVFTGMELLFFLYVLWFYRDRADFFQKPGRLVAFCVVALCTMILRNNGLYIVAIMLIYMLFGSRQYWKRFGLMLFGILVAYGLYVGPFYSALDVEAGGIEEMLSVPLQQMARVHRYDYESLSQEDLELLYQVVPKENLDLYRSTVSDFVKSGFQKEAFDANKGEFIKLWIKWGLEHPLTYVNSFLINTVDFWYPGAVVDGYMHANDRSSYFDYQVDEPGTEIVLLPKVHEFYEAISHDAAAQKVPFAFLVLSPGWYLIVSLVIFLYLWYQRSYRLMQPMFILVLSVLTVLLGPVALVRYVLILYYAFPVVLGMFLCHGEIGIADEGK